MPFGIVSTKRIPGPTITISCSQCRADSIQAISFEQTEQMWLVGIIPFLKFKNIFVQCSVCEASFLSRLGLDELDRYPTEEVQNYLAYRISLPLQLLAVAGLVLCWAPLIGLACALIAYLYTRKTPSWVRKLSLIALVPSGLITGVLLVGLLVESLWM